MMRDFCCGRAAYASCMLFDGDAPQSAVVAPNSLTQVCSRIPTNIAATKIRTAGAPEASEVSAGPGQKPPRPQPAPKIAAPRISFASRSPRLGREKSDASNGDGILLLQR